MEDNKDINCSPQTCQYHMLTESIIADLKEATQKLMEGQDQMREHIVQLTEAFKAMERIDRRIEKLESLAREKDKEQDCKIDELKSFMYKAVGAISALTVLGSFLIKFL